MASIIHIYDFFKRFFMIYFIFLDDNVKLAEVVQDPKSFPRDPATFVPFPFHYADEPKKPGHCDLKQGCVLCLSY